MRYRPRIHTLFIFKKTFLFSIYIFKDARIVVIRSSRYVFDIVVIGEDSSTGIVFFFQK